MKRIILILAAAAVLSLLVGCASSDYKKARGLYDEGKFAEAESIFVELGDYEDSREQITACRYGEAGALLKSGEFDAAEAAFTELGDYKDSPTMILQCRYDKACKLLDDEQFDEAQDIFEELGSFSDSAAMLDKSYELRAAWYLREHEYDAAIMLYTGLDDYSNADRALAAKRSALVGKWENSFCSYEFDDKGFVKIIFKEDDGKDKDYLFGTKLTFNQIWLGSASVGYPLKYESFMDDEILMLYTLDSSGKREDDDPLVLYRQK